MADTHYSTRLGKWLQLERSEANLKGGGWLDVVPKKLAGDKVGYHVKMRKDPNNSGAQDTLPGKALDSPREAAIRRAEWISEHPFPPKAAGRKVHPPFAPSFSQSYHVTCVSCLSQVKLKRKAEGKLGGGASFFPSGLGAGPQPLPPLERGVGAGHDPR